VKPLQCPADGIASCFPPTRRRKGNQEGEEPRRPPARRRRWVRPDRSIRSRRSLFTLHSPLRTPLVPSRRHWGGLCCKAAMPNLLSPSILEDPRQVGKKTDPPRPRACPQKRGICSQIGLPDERVMPEASERQSDRSVTARRTLKGDTADPGRMADGGRQVAEGGYSIPVPRSPIRNPPRTKRAFSQARKGLEPRKTGENCLPGGVFRLFSGFRAVFRIAFFGKPTLIIAST
jgi:hypothetical protein